MRALFLYSLLVSTALGEVFHLVARQSQTVVSCLNAAEKVCGEDCIPTRSVCCGSDGGFCSASYYCTVGNNGAGACCPSGKTCTGAGGTHTVPGGGDQTTVVTSGATPATSSVAARTTSTSRVVVPTSSASSAVARTTSTPQGTGPATLATANSTPNAAMGYSVGPELYVVMVLVAGRLLL